MTAAARQHPALEDENLRQRILRVATELFATQGFAGTSIRQLVDASGCTNPALYYYFDSKGTLFREVINLHIERVNELIKSWKEAEGSLRQRTHRVIELFIDYAMERPQHMRLMQRLEYSEGTSAEERDAHKHLLSSRDRQFGVLTAIFAKGIEGGELRGDLKAEECMIALIGGICLQFELALQHNQWNRESFHRLVDVLFDGIASRDTATTGHQDEG